MSRRRISSWGPDELEQSRVAPPAEADLGPLFAQMGDDLATVHGADAQAAAAAGLPPVRLEPPSVPIDTSEDAALRVMDRTAQLRARILAYITAYRRYGATEREIERGLDMEGQGSTVRPRLWELEGNVPAGRSPRARLIAKTLTRRDGMRVYVAVSCAPELR